MRQSSAPVQGRNTPGPAAHVRTHSAGGFSRQAGNPTITRDDTRTPMGVHSQKMVCRKCSKCYARFTLFCHFFSVYSGHVYAVGEISSVGAIAIQFAWHIFAHVFKYTPPYLYSLDGYFYFLLTLCSISMCANTSISYLYVEVVHVYCLRFYFNYLIHKCLHEILFKYTPLLYLNFY